MKRVIVTKTKTRGRVRSVTERLQPHHITGLVHAVKTAPCLDTILRRDLLSILDRVISVMVVRRVD